MKVASLTLSHTPFVRHQSPTSTIEVSGVSGALVGVGMLVFVGGIVGEIRVLVGDFIVGVRLNCG